MSTPHRPVGRRSPAVYRRRRLLVLVVLLLIVAAVALAITRPWSGGATGPAASGGTDSPSAPAASNGSPTGGSSSGATAPGSGSSPSATAAPRKAGDPCDASVVDLEAVTDKTHYGPGALPVLGFEITNTGSLMCTIDAGTDAQVYTITSGAETYWSSTDCQKNPQKLVIKLEPGQSVKPVGFSWDRTRSSKATCSATSRPAAPAAGASYHLGVSVGGVPSRNTRQFQLDG